MEPLRHDRPRMTTPHITSNGQYLRNRKCCAGVFSASERLTGEKVGIAAEMKRRVAAPCRSDLPIAIFDDPNNRGQETAPTREHKRTQENTREHKRPQSHDTPCLWERSPDRDFRNGPCRKSEQDESLWRRVRCAPEALPIIVESRLTTLA